MRYQGTARGGERIAADGVGDEVLAVGARNRHLPDREALAELQQPRLADEVGGRGSAQEIDVEMRGHRVPHRADIGENGGVERDVGEPEHRRPRDRAAGTQVPFVEDQTHPRSHRSDLLDDEMAVDLRKLLGEKGADVVGGEHGGLCSEAVKAALSPAERRLRKAAEMDNGFPSGEKRAPKRAALWSKANNGFR